LRRREYPGRFPEFAQKSGLACNPSPTPTNRPAVLLCGRRLRSRASNGSPPSCRPAKQISQGVLRIDQPLPCKAVADAPRTFSRRRVWEQVVTDWLPARPSLWRRAHRPQRGPRGLGNTPPPACRPLSWSQPTSLLVCHHRPINARQQACFRDFSPRLACRSAITW